MRPTLWLLQLGLVSGQPKASTLRARDTDASGWPLTGRVAGGVGARRFHPALECLEDRTVFNTAPLAAAVPLTFGGFNTAQVSHFLSSPSEVDLYRVMLQPGDSITASIQAQASGSGLLSHLRLFDAAGQPLAQNQQEGGDPRLSFQTATAGDFFIGVSSAPNFDYNPTLVSSGSPGATTGLYTLSVQLASAAPLRPDLTGSSFRLGAEMAEVGETIPVTFTVENRGGADPGNFQVQVLLGSNNRFDDFAKILTTLQRTELVASSSGGAFSSPAGFNVTLPVGQASGPVFLGLRIIPGVTESDTVNNSGVHRGADWAPLTVVTRVPAGVANLSQVDAGLNTGTGITQLNAGQTSLYSLTVSDTLGNGRLTAQVGAVGGSLQPRLTLSGPNGELLSQSDSGRLVQHLVPGTYFLAVSARLDSGTFQLSTDFIQTSEPFAPLVSGAGTFSVAVADVNNDGYPDVITANRIDNTLSVFLGNGDGTFQRPGHFAIGARVFRVAVADVNNDGKIDLLTGNKGDNTASVLLGNGDGTFQPQMVVAAGTRVNGAIAADINGDGWPDLLLDNYADDTIWVLLGNGNGTFDPPTSYPTDHEGEFQGVSEIEVADVNGDGFPDLIYPNYVAGNVAVRLNLGAGTFGPQRLFSAGGGGTEADVVDVNGDDQLDLIAFNAVDNSVSVLLGNGDGTFQTHQTYPVGGNPYAGTVADLNGDGHPDIITTNRDDNTVSVLLGKGDGTFQAQRVFLTGRTPPKVAVGDFNGDGRPDLVTANQGDNTAGVLLGHGDGTFSSGSQQIAPDLRPFQVVVADLNGDDRPDIATANRSNHSVGVLLSNPDGSFQTRETFATDLQPFGITAADLNGDGIRDLATANYAGGSVSILLGNGDGTFQPHQDLTAGSNAYGVRVDDLNGDHLPDIVCTNKNDNTIGVFLGLGGGAFSPMRTFDVASGPYELVIHDLNHDGFLDVVVSHFSAVEVAVLLGNGNGTFQPRQLFPIGSRPYGLAVADLNGDGNPDIATSNYRSSNASILFGDGKGVFAAPVLMPVGKAPNEVQVGDFNGDGILDLVTADYGSDSVSVLLGQRTGGFQPQQTFPAGPGPASVAVADVTGDGILDLVVGNRNASAIHILPGKGMNGKGDGTFQVPVPFGVGKNRYAVVVADVNGDGYPDLITARLLQNDVTVQLGNGTGTFELACSVAVGSAPTAVALADLNGDGRLDLITANSEDNSVSVLLGNGNGTFNAPQTFAVGRSPRGLAVADVNGDGISDLVVSSYHDASVSVLLGRGDGTFPPPNPSTSGGGLGGGTFATGDKPYSVAVSDVNGDGRPDLITANAAADSVSVLLGNGNGTFQPQQVFTTGAQPFALTAADVNGDGKPDLITANAFASTVSVLLGQGNGTFAPARTFAVGSRPYSVAVVDVDGDGHLDIVTVNYREHSISVLLGQGDGTFAGQQVFATSQLPVQTVVADINVDGRPDLVTVSNHIRAENVLLGLGDGTFQTVTAATGVGLRSTPFLVDLDGDTRADRVVLDRSGNLLLRQGLANSDTAFASPIILNPDRPARDITILDTGTGLVIAAADARFDATLSGQQFVFTVSLYTVAPSTTLGGSVSVTRQTAFSTTALPGRLATADLTGNGLGDLVAANAFDNSVTIALQTAPGQFAAPLTLPVGSAPADITMADVNGDGRLDVAVSNQASGDVTVLLNDGLHSFSRSWRFPAGTFLRGLGTTPNGAALTSLDRSVSLVAGDFTRDGQSDLVVVNAGVHGFAVLVGNGNGFQAPQVSLTTATSDGLRINDRASAVVAGDFNRDGLLDLAVLLEDTGQLWVYSGNGDGTFRHTFSIPVGDQATGLTVVPEVSEATLPYELGPSATANGGLLDLLVGNGFGDVLHLEGRGDGTFQISGKRVSLSVIPNLFGPGQHGVLVGNQQDNRVTVQTQTGGGQFEAVQTLATDTPAEQLAPGDVQWSVLGQSATLPDAVVVSTGSNAVVVYHTTAVSNGVPAFAPNPRTYFVGTAPASLTVADISGDAIPDMLVANPGSNDISIIFGVYDGSGAWVGQVGPRLRSGGSGPLAATVRDMNDDAVPDLVVTHGGSGTVTLLPGVGQGFFDDRNPQILFDLSGAVVQAPTFVGTSGLAYAVTAGGALVRFDLNNPAAGAAVVFTGKGVLAARALETGEVVVAVTGGTVQVLAPDGIGLKVVAELQAQGGVAALSSALEVVRSASGQLQVLVSSQGSDTIFVYAATAASPSSLLSGGSPALPVAQSAFVSTLVAVTSNTLAPGSSFGVASSGTAGGLTTGAASVPVSASAAPSFNGFLPAETSTTASTSGAILVPLQGNAYATVAVLDFGSTQDDIDQGVHRLPWLGASFPLGDTSPLMRLVIGQEEALQLYRDAVDTRTPEDGEAPLNDPWYEDLFYRHPWTPGTRRVETPAVPEPDEEAPVDGDSVEIPEGIDTRNFEISLPEPFLFGGTWSPWLLLAGLLLPVLRLVHPGGSSSRPLVGPGGGDAGDAEADGVEAD